MPNWRRVASRSDLQEGAPLGVECEGKSIGLFRVGDQIFALNDICPHEYALLSSGYQEGETVECPLHQAIFNLKTGEHLSPPAQCGVQTYPVKLEDDDVLVDVSNGGQS